MIRYALTCDREHAFESWFKDSEAFDQLSAQKRLVCPECGSGVVVKALMAPSVLRGSKASRTMAASEIEVDAPGAQKPQSLALLDDGQRKLREAVRLLHRKIVDTADDVGRAFPEEARRIHEGEAPSRSIYGQATGEEVKALLDDGVPLMAIPALPDDQH